MSENIYQIRNLNCSYNNGEKIVLTVDKLDIPKGKVTMFLGASGSGKSTILETLGLMNSTMTNQSQVLLFAGDETINYADLYEKSEAETAVIRNKYFSFIFQETNLMRNFSVYENACLTLMMQGVSRKDAEKKVSDMLGSMDLSMINRSTKPFDLSGGQKQRVAFVRAIVPEFKVLFGDEPTGNLDVNNAKRLITVLYNELKAKNASAIIVTHDLKLALTFADCLVVLEKRNVPGSSENEPDEQGYIFEDNVFHRQNREWKSAIGMQYSNDDLSHKIHSLMDKVRYNNGK